MAPTVLAGFTAGDVVASMRVLLAVGDAFATGGFFFSGHLLLLRSFSLLSRVADRDTATSGRAGFPCSSPDFLCCSTCVRVLLLPGAVQARAQLPRVFRRMRPDVFCVVPA
jgi:hypothetical protein